MGCPFHPVKLIIPLVGSPFTGYVFNRRRGRTRTCDRDPLPESHSLPTELHGGEEKPARLLMRARSLSITDKIHIISIPSFFTTTD